MASAVPKSRLLDLAKVRLDLSLQIPPQSVSRTPFIRPSTSLSQCLLTLYQLQSSIFQTTFNPTRARLGNKILRQRLKGPNLASYYPRKSATVDDMLREFKKFDLTGWNEEEEDRLEGIAIAKLRGKGAPKKKRTAEGMYSVLIGWRYSQMDCANYVEQKVGRTRGRASGDTSDDSISTTFTFYDTQGEIALAGAGYVQIQSHVAASNLCLSSFLSDS